MTNHFDRIVIGGGAMGLATTWQLASRGQQVLMLERFTPAHNRGASHGATRNLNNAYAESHYLDLYDEALRLWRELEQESGQQLLTLCGLVTHGNPLRVQSAYNSLRARGVNVELISAAEAESRWTGMRFEGEVLVNPDAGRIHAATALAVLSDIARKNGAKLQYDTQVVKIIPGEDHVIVKAMNSFGEETEYHADSIVVTAGAWSAQLLAGVVDLPSLRVTEEHPAHFAVRPEYDQAAWPSFNHFRANDEAGNNRGNIYGMLTPGEGIKVGFHATGDEVDPDNRVFRASDAARAELREHVATWFPGLDPDSANEVSCTYTLTDSERFVLDTRGAITVGAGFSGQGFKFVPAIGRVLADASLGVTIPPEAYLINSH